MTELLGHDSPDTSYLVADYPYGFTLRTEIRYWIETKPGQGQRLVSQTRNPKRADRPWNKPKASTYTPIRALYLDPATGHVENEGLSPYADEAAIITFRNRFPLTCASERNRKVIEFLIARDRGQKHLTWTVRSGDSTEPRQTPAAQAALLRQATAIELHKLREEGQ